MPQLVLFRGRPVKRREQVASGIRLILFSAIPGEPGESLTVPESEWREHSSRHIFSQRPDAHCLERQRNPDSDIALSARFQGFERAQQFRQSDIVAAGRSIARTTAPQARREATGDLDFMLAPALCRGFTSLTGTLPSFCGNLFVR